MLQAFRGVPHSTCITPCPRQREADAGPSTRSGATAAGPFAFRPTATRRRAGCGGRGARSPCCSARGGGERDGDTADDGGIRRRYLLQARCPSDKTQHVADCDRRVEAVNPCIIFHLFNTHFVLKFALIMKHSKILCSMWRRCNLSCWTSSWRARLARRAAPPPLRGSAAHARRPCLRSPRTNGLPSPLPTSQPPSRHQPANPQVVDAMRQTVSNMLGTLPPQAPALPPPDRPRPPPRCNPVRPPAAEALAPDSSSRSRS